VEEKITFLMLIFIFGISHKKKYIKTIERNVGRIYIKVDNN
jgi:hypothetical protein